MKALRSIACISARRTRTSSNGFFRLLIARMPLPALLPTLTTKRGSERNCFTACGASRRGTPSMSPASSAATRAAGSLMKRKFTRSSLTALASRKPGHFFSVTEVPFFHSSKVKGPVPTGLVAVPAALLASRITAVFSPIRNRKFGSALSSVRITVCASGVSTRRMLSNTAFLALLVLLSSFARSKLNFTSALSKDSPSWNLTPRFNLKV